MTLQAKTLKITAVITDFEQHLDLDTVGSKIVTVTIVDSTGGKLAVSLSSKSYRKAVAAFKEYDGNAAVIVSGELDMAARTINQAGIIVQQKVPKAVPEPIPSADVAVPVLTDPMPVTRSPVITIKKKHILEIPTS
ncbi:hypothetical protein [Propionivibrio sp.]|uniref:hypothetical protein n=1 Tax=Propionivibrio sp. TaxID=2212460 RepID=UPI003BF0ACCA